MAKKAAKKPTTKKPVAAPKPAPVEKATKASPAPDGGVTNDKIGYAAGDVWGALHGKGWQTLAAVKKSSGASGDLTLMAIGWLAREGKLDFTTSGRSVKVTLK